MFKLLGTSQSLLKRNTIISRAFQTTRLLQTRTAAATTTTTTKRATAATAAITHQPTKSKAATVIDARIQNAGKRHELKTIANEFEQIKDTNLKLSTTTYEAIIDAFVKLRKKNQPLTNVLEAYDNMLSQGSQPSSRIYEAMIRVLCERELEVKKTLGMLQRQVTRTGETVEGINRLKEEKNMDRAIQLFKEAMERNEMAKGRHLPFDTKLCNQLLLGLSHNTYINDALFVFEHMEERQLVNTQSYAAMVSLFGSAGNMTAANEYFEEYRMMRRKVGGRRREPFVHNALVSAYVDIGDIQGALNVVQNRMVEDQVHITMYPYNKIIRGAFQFEQQKVADDFFTQFSSVLSSSSSSSSINDNTSSTLPKPDANTFGIFLSNYSRLGQMEKAKQAYQLLQNFDLKTQYGHLANYVHACVENKLVDEALDGVLTITRTGLVLEEITCRRFFMTFAENKENKREVANALNEVMSQYAKHHLIHKKTPIVNLGFELAEQLCKENDDIFSAIRILQTLNHYTVPPHPTTSTIVLNKYMDIRSSEWDNVLSKKLNARHFTTLFETVFQRQDSTPNEFCQKALTLLKDMQKLHIKPSPGLYLRISTRMMKYDEFESFWKDQFTPFFPASRSKVEKPIERVNIEQEEATLGQSLNNNNNNNNKEKKQESQSDLLSAEALNAALGGKFDRAIDIIDRKIIQQEKIPTPEVIHDIILLSRQKNSLKAAENIYDIVSKPLLKQHMDQINAAAVAPSATTTTTTTTGLSTLYNAMLYVYSQDNHLSSAKQFYQNLCKENLRPDGYALASLLSCLVKNGDKELDPYTIYQDAKEKKAILPTYFYNILLSHLSNQHQLEEVLMTFDEMKSANVIPNTITYGSVISACLRTGSENHATRYFQEMIASPKYHPRISIYNHMMQFHLQQKSDREKALEYYNLSKHHHVQPTAHTFRLLIEAYATIPEYDMWTARQWIDRMKNEFHIKPTGIHYSMLIYSYGSLQKDVSSALEIYNDMRTKNILSDGVASYRMLNAFFDNDMDAQAYKLYQRLSERHKTTIHIENLFIEKYGLQGDLKSAEDTFCRLKDQSDNKDNTVSKGLVKDEDTYKAMMDAYVHNNKLQEASNLLEAAHRNGFLINESVSTLKQKNSINE